MATTDCRKVSGRCRCVTTFSGVSPFASSDPCGLKGAVSPRGPVRGRECCAAHPPGFLPSGSHVETTCQGYKLSLRRQRGKNRSEDCPYACALKNSCMTQCLRRSEAESGRRRLKKCLPEFIPVDILFLRQLFTLVLVQEPSRAHSTFWVCGQSFRSDSVGCRVLRAWREAPYSPEYAFPECI